MLLNGSSYSKIALSVAAYPTPNRSYNVVRALLNETHVRSYDQGGSARYHGPARANIRRQQLSATGAANLCFLFNFMADQNYNDDRKKHVASNTYNNTSVVDNDHLAAIECAKSWQIEPTTPASSVPISETT